MRNNPRRRKKGPLGDEVREGQSRKGGWVGEGGADYLVSESLVSPGKMCVCVGGGGLF